MPGVNAVEAADRGCLSVVPGLCCSGHCLLRVLGTSPAWPGPGGSGAGELVTPRSLFVQQSGGRVACLRRGVVYDKNLLHEQNSDDMQTLKQELPATLPDYFALQMQRITDGKPVRTLDICGVV